MFQCFGLHNVLGRIHLVQSCMAYRACPLHTSESSSALRMLDLITSYTRSLVNQNRRTASIRPSASSGSPILGDPVRPFTKPFKSDLPDECFWAIEVVPVLCDAISLFRAICPKQVNSPPLTTFVPRLGVGSRS